MTVTLQDIALPISVSDARLLALVFDQPIADRLAELHNIYGTVNCIPLGIRLDNGRYAINADVLTEIGPGGLLHRMWDAADKSILLPAVEVVPWADAEAMMPPSQPIV